MNQRIGFANHRIRIVINGFVDEKLTERAFALFHAVRDFLEIFAEDLQIRDEVVRSLNDLADIAFFCPLDEASIRDDFSFLRTATDVDLAVAE